MQDGEGEELHGNDFTAAKNYFLGDFRVSFMLNFILNLGVGEGVDIWYVYLVEALDELSEGFWLFTPKSSRIPSSF